MRTHTVIIWQMVGRQGRLTQEQISLLLLQSWGIKLHV